MNRQFFSNLTADILAGKLLDPALAADILTPDQIELLPLLDAAYEVRKTYWGKEVSIHIINNAQNGHCPEDCHYCAQAKSASSAIEEYPLKSESEILAEAKNAYESGAFRYCMVFAGRGPSSSRVERLAQLIRKIKENYPIQICVSTGLLDDAKAQVLKDAGLDRLNHNLNTSRRHYPEICTTHTYDDRLNTLRAARNAGIELCSGLIVGMGEKTEDIVEVAYTLRELQSPSIPVNFYIPITGTVVKSPTPLSPEYCLRVLCLFRLTNPKAEIRIAAGRELHLRSMEVMALYPANSLFLDGYLNAKGASPGRTLKMIKDAGFDIKSEHSLDDLLAKAGTESVLPITAGADILLKGIKELRPYMAPAQP